MMFFKENGMFKKDHAYSTASQRTNQDKKIKKVMKHF